MEALINIILGGIGGALSASLITIYHDIYKNVRSNRNLLKGFISEIVVNREYLSHNFNLAVSVQEEKIKSRIFILMRTDCCSNLLTSGKIKLNKEVRKATNHYLVTLDYLNHMINRFENMNSEDEEFAVTLERIKRYCRSEEENYPEEFDFVLKHLQKVKGMLFSKKRYLKRHFN